MNKHRLVVLILFLLALSACMAVLTEAQKVSIRCDSDSALDFEIIQCYKQENAKFLTRKINLSVHGLTAGDWPFDYQFIYQVNLSRDGKVQKFENLKKSNSHRLNKVVTKAVKNISEYFVPKNELFVSGSFEQLKIMIVPARTPILEKEIVVDQDTLLIYLTESCSLRSDRC